MFELFPNLLALPRFTSGALVLTRAVRVIQPANTARLVSTMANNCDTLNLNVLFRQKQDLRSKLRRLLKSMDPSVRAQEDKTIQSIVLRSQWFNSSQRICSYVSSSALREVETSKLLSEILQIPTKDDSSKVAKKIYVPRVEENEHHMRMMRISCLDELSPNSMGILQPDPLDSEGNVRENVMLATDPVDLFLLPGLAFDRSGRRLGRGGGYYDKFLSEYKKMADERNWRQPLLVALSYSFQIVDEEVISVTPNDVLVDALVSPLGVIPISHLAKERVAM